MTRIAVEFQRLRDNKESLHKSIDLMQKETIDRGMSRILLVKGSSGLGNRIAVLLTGILYARTTGRKLMVDWRDGLCAPRGTNAFPLLFESPLSASLDGFHEGQSVHPPIWQNCLDQSVEEMLRAHGPKLDPNGRRRLLSIDLSRSDYDDDVLILWAYNAQMQSLRRHLRGRLEILAGDSDEAILRSVIRSDLVPRPEIRARVDEFRRERLGPRTVGVHVRYSDYRGRLWSTLRRLNALLASEPDLRIFLATDNVEVQRLFEANYPGIVTAPHWYPPAGRPIHYAARGHAPLATTIEALVDLYVLAACDWLIADPSSSFAYLAKLLSTVPAARVFEVGPPGKGSLPSRLRIWKVLLRLGAFTWGLRMLPRLIPVRRL